MRQTGAPEPAAALRTAAPTGCMAAVEPDAAALRTAAPTGCMAAVEPDAAALRTAGPGAKPTPSACRHGPADISRQPLACAPE